MEIRLFHNKIAYNPDRPNDSYWKIVVLQDGKNPVIHEVAHFLVQGVGIATRNDGWQHGYPRFHLIAFGEVRIRGRTAFIVPEGSVAYPSKKDAAKAG